MRNWLKVIIEDIVWGLAKRLPARTPIPPVDELPPMANEFEVVYMEPLIIGGPE